jgi:phosphoribosylformylglycinamidine (FGAM) synthase-like enzyme
MTLLTIKIDERTKEGKAFMAMTDVFFKNKEGIEITKSNSRKDKKEESPYNPDFVAMVKKAQKSKKRTVVNPNDVWGSLGLK